MSEHWKPLTLDEVRERFAGFDVDWWVAGGVAIDLFVGWETRPHEDIDLEMFRGDRDVLFDVFDGWEMFVVSEGNRHRWHRAMTLDPKVFGVWGRPSAASPWAVEIMLADGDGDEWRFRRDNEISFPRGRLTHTTADGIAYCVPEVQLLFKAKKHRTKDDADMVRCLHRLDRVQREWLLEALGRSEPGHPWCELIRQAAVGVDE